MHQLIVVLSKQLIENVTDETKKEKHRASVIKIENAMKNGQAQIVVANSAEGPDWDYSDYEALARQYGYSVYILDNVNKTLTQKELD